MTQRKSYATGKTAAKSPAMQNMTGLFVNTSATDI
jgi:hypothetical protein